MSRSRSASPKRPINTSAIIPDGINYSSREIELDMQQPIIPDANYELSWWVQLAPSVEQVRQSIGFLETNISTAQAELSTGRVETLREKIDSIVAKEKIQESAFAEIKSDHEATMENMKIERTTAEKELENTIAGNNIAVIRIKAFSEKIATFRRSLSDLPSAQ